MTESTSHCENCGAALAPGVKFCGVCGQPVRARFCEQCGSRVAPGLAFCETCGSPVGAQAAVPQPRARAAPVAPPAALEGESDAYEQPKHRTRRKRRGGWLVLLVLVLLLIGAAAAAWYFGLVTYDPNTGQLILGGSLPPIVVTPTPMP